MKTKDALCLMLAMLCQMTVSAQRFEYKGPDGQKLFFNVITDNKVEVTCMSPISEKYYFRPPKKNYPYSRIVIPQIIQIKGLQYIVSAIGEQAFDKCETLTQIEIPSSIEKIGHCSFRGCKKLASVQIPNSVLSIGQQAFYGCASLEGILIPNSVVSILSDAFSGCAIKSINLPNNVKKIQSGTFTGCDKLEKVKLPYGLTKIEQRAFSYCPSLREIYIPPTVQTIESRAFNNCGLQKVYGLYSGMSIASDAFVNDNEFLEKHRFTLDKINTFEYAYNSYIIPKILKWQQKDEFETLEQYAARVTKENQQKMLNQLSNEAIAEYVKKHDGHVWLGEYDEDYELYPLNSAYGSVYIKVPQSEKEAFRSNFKDVKLDDMSFAIVNDSLRVKFVSLVCNGKKYQSIRESNEEVATVINMDLPEIVMPINSDQSNTVVQKENMPVDNAIDLNIPTEALENNRTFSVIICNEKYQRVASVPFAQNDGRVFAEYCKKTLGVPAQNVRIYENATYGTMLAATADIKKISEAYKGGINVIFYYAGHGIPNESTKDAFLLPVDADGQQTEACYPVSRLYKELGTLGAKNVVVFLDACFSGAQRGEGMLASARGVALKAKAEIPLGNMVVFSAATGDETAYPYKEKGHGMFTYFLLKKLRDTKGNCTLGELSEYIQANVRQQAVVVNRKSQTPTVVPSANVAENWKSINLK